MHARAGMSATFGRRMALQKFAREPDGPALLLARRVVALISQTPAREAVRELLRKAAAFGGGEQDENLVAVAPEAVSRIGVPELVAEEPNGRVPEETDGEVVQVAAPVREAGVSPHFRSDLRDVHAPPSSSLLPEARRAPDRTTNESGRYPWGEMGRNAVAGRRVSHTSSIRRNFRYEAGANVRSFFSSQARAWRASLVAYGACPSRARYPPDLARVDARRPQDLARRAGLLR